MRPLTNLFVRPNSISASFQCGGGLVDAGIGREHRLHLRKFGILYATISETGINLSSREHLGPFMQPAKICMVRETAPNPIPATDRGSMVKSFCDKARQFRNEDENW